MSLFGGQSSGSSLFGSNAQKPSNPFANFGSSQPAQQSGLFTSSPTTVQPQSSGGLFGSTFTSQTQQQSGGLFGSSTSAQPQQQTGGGLFGATSSQPPQSGGLFGSLASSQPQQQQTGGLFGSTTSNPQQQQQPGLFGSTNATSGSSSLFNQNQNQTQQQTQQTGDLFGAANTQQNKPTLSLFGGTNNNNLAQTQQPQQQSSLFANSAFGASANAQSKTLFGSSNAQQPAQPQTSLFGSTANKMPGTLTMGQGNSQVQQQTVPGVRIDVSNLRGTTRFNDLHDDLQKQIEQIDTFIQQQISYKEQCDALMPAHEQSLSTIPNDVSYIKSQVEATESALENDSSATSTVKAIIQKDAEDARIGFRAVENLKLPQQFHYSGIWHPSTATITPPRGNAGDRSSSPASSGESTDLVSYFNAQVSELSKMLETYKRNISEIETHLGTVEASSVAQSQQLMFRKERDGGARSKEEQVRELAAVLREFEAGIVGVAGKLGKVRENVVYVVEHGQGGVLAARR